MVLLVEKQQKGLRRQNSLDWLTEIGRACSTCVGYEKSYKILFGNLETGLRGKIRWSGPSTNKSVYPKITGLAVWSENCKRYSSLQLGAAVSLFYESG
jgi:hypothetical protein